MTLDEEHFVTGLELLLAGIQADADGRARPGRIKRRARPSGRGR